MKKVVIIGGGFAGAKCAKNLEKDFDVTLIDLKEYFEFTPGILKTLINPKHKKSMHAKHKRYLKKAKFLVGEVRELSDRYVLVNEKKIKFDYLIIASGSEYESPMKDPDVLLVSRGESVTKYNSKIEKAGDILVVGGGLVGTELSAELSYKYPNKRICLVDRGQSLMKRNNPKSIRYATNFLKKRGVEIVFSREIKSKIRNEVTTNDKNIKAGLVLLCTGIKPNSKFMRKNFKDKLDDRGFIKTNHFLQMEGYENIFVAGDVTSIKEEKLAQTAEIHAKVIVNNIRRIEEAKELLRYKSKRRLVAIGLGPFDGILEYRNLVIFGLFPAFVKWFVEWKTMIRYK